MDLTVAFIGVGRPLEPGSLLFGEPLSAAAQHHRDSFERVVGTAAVAVEFLLEAAADLVAAVPSLVDVEGVQNRGSVLQWVIDGVLVAVERVRRRHRDAGTERAVARP